MKAIGHRLVANPTAPSLLYQTIIPRQATEVYPYISIDTMLAELWDSREDKIEGKGWVDGVLSIVNVRQEKDKTLIEIWEV